MASSSLLVSRWARLVVGLLTVAASLLVAPAAHAATPGGTIVIGTQDLNWTCNTASGCAGQWQPIGVADVNGDHHADLVWWNATTGQVSAWLLDGAGHGIGFWSVAQLCPDASTCSGWIPRGVADMNGDGHPDIVWYSQVTGLVRIWLISASGVVTATQYVNWQCGGTCNWTPVGLGDMNGDGHADLVWLQSNLPSNQPSSVGSWLLDGAGHVVGTQSVDWACAIVASDPGQDCGDGYPSIVGVADFNRDGHQDLLFFGLAGVPTEWDLDGAGHVLPPAQKTNWVCATSACRINWQPRAVGDLNDDGEPDILWWNRYTGVVSSWLLNRPS